MMIIAADFITNDATLKGTFRNTYAVVNGGPRISFMSATFRVTTNRILRNMYVTYLTVQLRI